MTWVNQANRLDKLAEGYIKRIHVDKQRIARKEENPLTIQTSQGPLKASEVIINGPSRLVYLPEDPLSCGAKLWIETKAEVEIVD